jgi:hypothetical protein
MTEEISQIMTLVGQKLYNQKKISESLNNHEDIKV